VVSLYTVSGRWVNEVNEIQLWNTVEMILAKNRRTRWRACPGACLSTTNLTRTGPELNSSVRGEYSSSGGTVVVVVVVVVVIVVVAVGQ
jgi:hypothetical protein